MELYESQGYQAAVLDIELPGISGIEAAEILRKKDKDCSIIFLTAFDEFSYARKAITVRALDYLLKPFDENELILVLEEALRIAEKKQEDKEESGFCQEEESWRDELEEEEESGDARQLKVAQMMEEYIKANYMYDISMPDAAKSMNYSETYFSKLFKQCFQKNFTSSDRISGGGSKTPAAAAYGQCQGCGKSRWLWGFQLFYQVFRRITGMSPTEYRTSIFREE